MDFPPPVVVVPPTQAGLAVCALALREAEIDEDAAALGRLVQEVCGLDVAVKDAM